MRRALALVAVAATIGTVGCVRPANHLEVVTDAASAATTDQRIVVSSRALDRRVRFGEVVSRKEGLILHVQVSLENTTSSVVPFEYRWEWTDGSGFQLGDTLSSWQPAVLNGNERKLMTGTGPGPSATSFRLYVRDPE